MGGLLATVPNRPGSRLIATRHGSRGKVAQSGKQLFNDTPPNQYGISDDALARQPVPKNVTRKCFRASIYPVATRITWVEAVMCTSLKSRSPGRKVGVRSHTRALRAAPRMDNFLLVVDSWPSASSGLGFRV